ncbi:MAG: response regulator transcription factor [Actinomycetia bacterium]|nr:response regulator transcription factor [Actinomycetes bacterium]
MRTAVALDDWALLRGGIEMTMRQHGISTVISVGTLSECVAQLNDRPGERQIDFIVVGQMKDSSQLAAVSRLAQTGAKVIAITPCATPSALVELCTEGAFGVLGRDGDLSAAVASVANGDRYVAPGLLATMFEPAAQIPHQPRFDLTERERQVLTELATGRSNGEISERLLIGTQTVKTHLSNIYDKLGVHRRTHAVRLALSHSLV